MNKYKEELSKLRPWILIVTYAVVLLLVIFKIDIILAELNKWMGYLSPFFIGIVMAFVFNIPMCKLEEIIINKFDEASFIREHKRGTALTISVILVTAIIGIILSFVIPEIFSSISRIIENASMYYTSAINNIGTILKALHIDTDFLMKADFNDFLKMFNLDYGTLVSDISNFILGAGTNMFGQVISLGGQLFNGFMGFMISLYILGSKDKLIKQANMINKALFNEEVADRNYHICHVTNEIFKDFLGGKLLESIIVGLILYLMLITFKVPYALLVAVICGVATLIPMIGSLIATIIGVLLLISIDPIKALIFFIAYNVVMNIDGNFIYPKFIGRGLGLPALWIMVSVFFFGGLWGAIGMLVAVPLSASIYTFGSDYIKYKLEKKNINIE